MVLALEGIRVLDLTMLFPGPFGTRYLSDFGADVIKIESRVRQDMARMPPPVVKIPGSRKKDSYLYHALNRNKKNISLNLKTDEGKEIFYKLAKTADVIVEQFRPGVVKNLGVDYETIKKINPRIIYCSITGYGQNGPYRDLAGHDINYIGTSGVASVTRDRETKKPIVPGLQIGDMFGGGLHAVIGILTALIAREKTGRGQYIDIAMMDGTLSFLPMVLSAYLIDNIKKDPTTFNLSGGIPNYWIYKCKDGKYITIGALEPKFYNNLLKVLGAKEISKQEAEDKGKTVQDLMFKQFQELFLTKTRDEWVEELNKVDTCVAPMNELWEVEDNPQVKARKMIIDVPIGEGQTMKQIGFPIKMSDTPAKILFVAPPFSQHTIDILKELGYNDEEIKVLKKKKVI
ncbi:MAG: CaiB/BaiF CoA transferase family protein [Candidatus Helarchaeota archaeon]